MITGNVERADFCDTYRALFKELPRTLKERVILYV